MGYNLRTTMKKFDNETIKIKYNKARQNNLPLLILFTVTFMTAIAVFPAAFLAVSINVCCPLDKVVVSNEVGVLFPLHRKFCCPRGIARLLLSHCQKQLR